MAIGRAYRTHPWSGPSPVTQRGGYWKWLDDLIEISSLGAWMFAFEAACGVLHPPDDRRFGVGSSAPRCTWKDRVNIDSVATHSLFGRGSSENEGFTPGPVVIVSLAPSEHRGRFTVFVLWRDSSTIRDLESNKCRDAATRTSCVTHVHLCHGRLILVSKSRFWGRSPRSWRFQLGNSSRSSE